MTNYEKGDGGQIQLGQVLLQVARLGCEGAITCWAITCWAISQKTSLGQGMGWGLRLGCEGAITCRAITQKTSLGQGLGGADWCARGPLPLGTIPSSQILHKMTLSLSMSMPVNGDYTFYIDKLKVGIYTHERAPLHVVGPWMPNNMAEYGNGYRSI